MTPPHFTELADPSTWHPAVRDSSPITFAAVQPQPMFLTVVDEQTRTAEVGRVIGWTPQAAPIVAWLERPGETGVVEGRPWWLSDSAREAQVLGFTQTRFLCPQGHGRMTQRDGQLWSCEQCPSGFIAG